MEKNYFYYNVVLSSPLYLVLFSNGADVDTVHGLHFRDVKQEVEIVLSVRSDKPEVGWPGISVARSIL